MPSKTRACKSTIALKENINARHKGNQKPVTKTKNPSRKVLADKTNSASDNESIEIHEKNVTKAALVSLVSQTNNKTRLRRERRLPNRFVENQVLINLSNSKENATITPVPQDRKSQTPAKITNNSAVQDSFKTPVKTSPLKVERPKRICRLPSKFEDNALSSNKFIPVQPVHASTPIVQNKVTKSKSKKDKIKLIHRTPNKIDMNKENSDKKTAYNTRKHNSDTNNNAKQGKLLHTKKVDAETKMTKKLINPKNKTSQNNLISVPNSKQESPRKTIAHIKTDKVKNFSFRVLESKKQSDNDKRHDLDVYEFTFDPNEEPSPQKKKKKKVVRKKPNKPKTVIFKSNYNLNLSKILSTLKSTVNKKSAQKAAADTSSEQHNVSVSSTNKDVSVIEQPLPTTKETNINKDKHISIRVEDIAADFQPSVDHADINYSPINTPMRPITPTQLNNRDESNRRPVFDDPLNLKENESFFDDQPVASSSMNMSARHPHASPWRVEFENLPIRWHANSYTKANMTPAVECSFVDFDTNKRKHVYTNIVPQAIETLQDIVYINERDLKQTSIISFIKEKAEMSVNKKRGRSKTPTRTDIFDELTKTNDSNKTPKKVVTPRKVGDKSIKRNTGAENVSPENKENIKEHLKKKNYHELNVGPARTPRKEMDNESEENIREHLKRKNNSELNVLPAKNPRRENVHDDTFFGFDDSEDLENISPEEVTNQKAKSLRPRARAVLKEINKQAGPTRAIVLTANKAKTNSDIASKPFEEIKSVEPASVFPEKRGENGEIISVEGHIDPEINNEESVHLFEDIEFIHHLKEHRKSYGKAKKVVFRQRSTSTSETQDSEIAKESVDSFDEDDLHDLTFEIPAAKQRRTVNKKKETKKQKQNKKEDKEAEEWAAGFNSMCEEIDEFPLVFE